MTKKPRKGKSGKHESPIKGKKDKTKHSDPKRPLGRERPPKGENPTTKKFKRGDDGFSASG